MRHFLTFIIATLLSVWTAYGQESSEELVYLQTDKGIYETGEDLWFKSYVFNRRSLTLSDRSKTLFVELIDRKDSIVWQEKYFIESGIADGHIYVDKHLKPGDYRLHGYTKHSFSGDTLKPYYPKIIRIVKHITDKGIQSKNASERKVARLTFFPEGGCLIDGIVAKVAFKAVDAKGMPVEISGELRENGKRVARLTSTHDGMGVCMLLPHKDVQYTAVLDDGTEYGFPKVEPAGLSLRLYKQTDEVLEFHLSQQKESSPRKIRLEGKMRGEVYCAAEGILSEVLKVRIPVKEFSLQGIAEFTLYDEAKLPMAERLVYLNPKKKLNIEIKADKNRYSTKGKGKISVRVSDENGNPVRAHLGMSLYDASYTYGETPEHILSYSMLSTEIKGHIHNPAYYFNENNKDRLQALDLLLLTQGWRKYVWNTENRLSGSPLFLSDEITGRQITGKKKKQKETEGTQQLLQVFGPNTQTQFLMTDTSGCFTLPAELMLALRGGYIYLKPMLDKDKYHPVIRFKDDFVRADSLRKRCRCYYARQDTDYTNTAEEFNPFVTSRDSSILLSEVTVTGTKGRVFRDKMMGKLDSLAQMDFGPWVCSHGWLENYKEGYTHHHDPRYCPFGDNDGNKPRRKPIIGQTYPIGKYKYIGGYAFEVSDYQYVVYEGPFYTEEELLRMNNMYRIKGYYGKREFYQPDETDMLSPIPDARNVLLWKPDIVTDQQGCAEIDFFCSDINTEFIGVIEGTDGMGNMGTAACEFRVMKLNDARHPEPGN